MATQSYSGILFPIEVHLVLFCKYLKRREFARSFYRTASVLQQTSVLDAEAEPSIAATQLRKKVRTITLNSRTSCSFLLLAASALTFAALVRGRLRNMCSHEANADGAGLTAIPVMGYRVEALEHL